MAESKSNATSFKKGREKTGGRKAGVPNRTTTFLRDAIILAAEAVGSDGTGKDGVVGYLIFVASTNVTAFCSLLGRVLPLQPDSKEHMETRFAHLSDEELEAEFAPPWVTREYPYSRHPRGTTRRAQA